MGIKRRMIDIVKKIVFTFCAFAFQVSEKANMTRKKLYVQKSKEQNLTQILMMSA
jgi:hypothetical protein